MLKSTITYKDNSKEVTKDIEKSISIAVEKSLVVMTGNIQKNTPVKEGHLRRSIQYKMNGPREGEVHTNPVDEGVEVNYAVHVEYGTKHMAPRAMFRKGVAQSEDRIKQIFADELKK